MALASREDAPQAPPETRRPEVPYGWLLWSTSLTIANRKPSPALRVMLSDTMELTIRIPSRPTDAADATDRMQRWPGKCDLANNPATVAAKAVPVSTSHLSNTTYPFLWVCQA